MWLAKRKVKCPLCGTMNNKEDTIQNKDGDKRYYCNYFHEGEDKTCFEKKKESLKRNKEFWDELFELIKEIYGKEPTGQMYSQLSKFKNEPYNYSNVDIYLALKYHYVILENEVRPLDGIGIVPYVVDKALNYSNDIMNNLNKAKEVQDTEYEIRKIKIKIDKENNVSNDKSKKLDLNEIDFL